MTFDYKKFDEMINHPNTKAVQPMIDEIMRRMEPLTAQLAKAIEEQNEETLLQLAYEIAPLWKKLNELKKLRK